MRRCVLALLALALCVPPTFAAAAGGQQPRRPNIVLVFADDMGYGDLSCFGNKTIRTPHLDGLAKKGMRFTSFYVSQAVCSASRASLLTGCYNGRVGIQGALGPASKHGIHDDEVTLGELLKSIGYVTAIFGKWHLGHLERFLPTHHGFDEYYGLPYSNDMWPKHPTAKFPDLPLISGTKTIELNPDQRKLTTTYTEKAVDFIRRNKDRPFFLYLPHAMPHVPLFVNDLRKGKSAGGLYGDVIEEIDWSMGRILAALKEYGLEENTLVIFTSDNGPWLSYGNHSGTAGPLREGKGTAWEGGVRVPCIMAWPGKIPAGKECPVPAMTIDILPTIARLTGAELPKHTLDGKDISPLMMGEKGARSPHEAYYFWYGGELHGVRSGRWKLYFPHQYRTLAGGPGGKDGRPAPYKAAKIGLALFELENDLGETTDVAARYPEIVGRLSVLGDRMRDEIGDSATKRKGKGVRPAGR